MAAGRMYGRAVSLSLGVIRPAAELELRLWTEHVSLNHDGMLAQGNAPNAARKAAGWKPLLGGYVLREHAIRLPGANAAIHHVLIDEHLAVRNEQGQANRGWRAIPPNGSSYHADSGQFALLVLSQAGPV